MPKKANRNGNLSRLPAALLQKALSYLGDFKCPECKAYALFVAKGKNNAPTAIRCRKCPFTATESEFVRKHMKLEPCGDGYRFCVPDPLGGEERWIEWSK